MTSSAGNEEDYVLVSVVRTNKSGFLKSQNRMNVMLSRCRAGMVIVTNRAFLRTDGQHTMLGSLSKYWERLYGESKTWADWKLVAEQKADMPGAPGLHRAAITTPISIPYSKSSGYGGKAAAARPTYRTQAWRDEHFPPLPGNPASNYFIRDSWSTLTSSKLQRDASREIKSTTENTTARDVQVSRSSRIGAATDQSVSAVGALVSPRIPLASSVLQQLGGGQSVPKLGQAPRPQIQGRWNQGFHPNVMAPDQTSSLDASVQSNPVSHASRFTPTTAPISPSENHSIPDLDNNSHFPSLVEISPSIPVQGRWRNGTGANAVKGTASVTTNIVSQSLLRRDTIPAASDKDDNFLPLTRLKEVKRNKRNNFRSKRNS